MKIYFTCSTAEFKKYKKNYFVIRDFLINKNHILTRDWLPRAKHRIDTNEVEITDIKEVYDACMKAINEADIVITEDTVSNFSTGHQITVALQRQKPTLVLWNKPKHKHFKKTFIQGIESDILEYYEYTQNNYQEIVRTFIKKYENAGQKTRFNLVLDEVERKYLEWAQFNKKRSRTKVIRESLRNTIVNDADYSRYLKSEK